MIIKIVLPIISLLTTNTPQIGNIYAKSVIIPFIGKQYIETEYSNKNTAFIRLTGEININGTSTLYNKNNKQIIKLSDNLIKTMNKFNCKINNSYYDINNDIIIITLCFSSIITKNIILKKINNNI